VTLAIAIAFGILILALVVFALEIFSIDFVAFGIMALILLLGNQALGLLPVDASEAISGFSSEATITVLAMFILSGAIYRTGAINLLAKRVTRLAGGGEFRQLIVVMLVVGPISMFINNTAAVAILIPMVISLSREYKRSPSRLLMPLSYTSQLAGVVTLIGTSTNILASSEMAKYGIESFGMFEFAKIGLLILATGAVYLLTIGRVLIPNRRSESAVSENYDVARYLTEVVVLESSPLVGKTLVECRIRDRLDIDVLDIIRHGEKLGFLIGDKELMANDVLLVRANSDELRKISDEEGLSIEPQLKWEGDQFDHPSAGLLEVVIAPNSELIGGTLESTNFRNRYSCTVIGMRKHGQLVKEKMSKVRLSFGDTLLLQGTKSTLEQMKREPGFIITEEMMSETFRQDKIPIALAIIGGVVLGAALGLKILITSIVGCVAMVLTGCLKVNELHESIRWDVIFLLAGIIPLGLAIEHTGGSDLLAGWAQSFATSLTAMPPELQGLLLLYVFYLTAMILTELISNNATVVVMVPVGIATASAMGIDPKAVILAIMFAASTSFSTPVGYQTNTMIYGPGGYHFLDFLRVGGPLNLLLAIITPLLIYLIWGLGS